MAHVPTPCRQGEPWAFHRLWCVPDTLQGPRSLSDLGNRSENSVGRGQILSILKVNSCSIDQESGEIWTVQTDLQQIYSKPLSLLNNPGGSAYPPGALNQIRCIRL